MKTWSKFYCEMIDRNIGVLTTEEQEKLRKSCVVVAGCGGMGGASAKQLVRLGIGHVKIADFDSFAVHNLSRQCGSTSKNLGKNKAEVLSEHFRNINPELKLDVFNKGVTAENVREFVQGASIVIDGTDYSRITDTVAMYRAARALGVCVISPQAIGFGASVLVFGPETVSFEEYIGLSPDPSKLAIEKLAPYIPTYADKEIVKKAIMKEINIPNLIMQQHLGTSIAISEAAMLILGRVSRPKGPDPRIFIVDLQDRKFEVKG